MPVLFTNNASAPLAASIGAASTSITVTTGQGSLFPAVAAGSFFYATLTDSSNNLEIVRVTARSGDTMTVVRAQEGTAARSYAAADKIELRVTAAGLNNMLQLDGAQAVTGNKVFSGNNSFTGVQTFTQTIVGSINGNAATVTNGVYTTGDQTIAGVKTFSSTIVGNLQGNVTGNVTGDVTGNATTATTAAACSGNAATVTNGVYTVGNQTIGGSKTFSSVVTNSAGRYTTANTGLGMYEMHLPGIVAHGWYLSPDGVTRLGVTNGAGVVSTVLLSVDGSGNTNVTGDITATSDERLKTNWRDLPDNFLELLAAVKHGIYERKDTGHTQAGVSAQGMLSALPEVVLESADGLLSVNYGNAALVASIKLANEVLSLRRELNELKGA